MSNHMIEWLNAYLDGELKGSRLYQVEQHLLECDTCRAELESLRSVSTALHAIPAPEFTPSGRFAAQVSLRLPHEPIRLSSRRKALEFGWWMIPVSLFTIWVFISTSSLVTSLIAAASNLGMLNSAPAWLVQSPTGGAFWSNTLAEFGLLSGTSLQWTEVTEIFAKQLTWQVSIALVYLAWIAIWWARQKREGRGQLLES